MLTKALSHPAATAKYFRVLITNILTTMISGGVLRPIKAYFGTVESQGRSSLHFHRLIWLDHDMKPTDLQENIQDVNFREKLKAYLEDIIKEDLDNFKEKHVFEDLNSINLVSSNIYFSFHVLVSRSFNTPPRISQSNIYATLRTVGLTDCGQNEF